MKILYITPAFQHPTMRGPTRCYFFIKELAKRHDITLLSLTSCEITPSAKKEMAEYAKRILTFSTNASEGQSVARVVGQIPLVGTRILRYLSHHAAILRMKEAFQRLVRQEPFDIVLFHGKTLISVIKDFDGVPIVVDFCDATSMRVRSKMQHVEIWKRPFFLLRYWQVKRLEDALLRKTRHVAFVSDRDRQVIMGSNNNAKVVSIGVDHDFWKRKTGLPSSKVIVFTGVMNYSPNEDATLYLIDKILPIVRGSIPDVEVCIVGRDPAPALQNRAESRPEITVTGFVDDVRPYLERAALSAVPLRFGSGVQNKILEAMAMEVPVVTTSLAAAGLQVGGSQSQDAPVLVADNASDVAQHIVHLLNDDGARAQLARDGRRFVLDHYNWVRNAEQLEAMCIDACKEKSCSTL